MTRYAAALLAGVVLALAPAAPAAAHASLLETDPAEGQVLAESPGEARLTFDETVSVSADGVQVFDAQGESVTSEAATRDEVLTVDLPDELAEGTYVVSWRVVSADGHPVAGALTFSVGKPSAVVKKPPTNQEAADGTVRGILSAVQGVGYLGLFVAAGLVLFVAWLLPGAARLEALRRRLLGVARAAAGVAALAAVMQVPLSGAYQQGLGLDGVAEGAGWSAATGRELVAVLLLVGGLLVAVTSLRSGPPVAGRRTAASAGVALALIAPAAVGHSRAYPPQWLAVGTDVLHVAAGAVWLGGLVGLALSLPVLAGRARAAAETLSRFSSVAAGVLVALVGSGSVLAWRIVGSWDDLFGTAYGRLLIVKVMVAALAVGIAGFNRFALLPRVHRAGDNAERREAATAIRQTIMAEASVLVGRPAAHRVPGQPVPTPGTAGDRAEPDRCLHRAARRRPPRARHPLARESWDEHGDDPAPGPDRRPVRAAAAPDRAGELGQCRPR